MKYCCKCGEIFSDESEYYYENTCAHCGTLLKCDDMTSQKFKYLSEEEKDEYELEILEIAKKSGEFDEKLHEKNCQPGTPFFYYCHRYDKYEKLAGIKKEEPPKDSGGGTVFLFLVFSLVLFIAVLYGAAIRKEHPFASMIICLVVVMLGILGKGLKSILFPNHTKEQENKRAEKYRRHHGATCPYCKSVNTYKISDFSKGVSLGLFGKYAIPKACKEWHCDNCDSNF